MLLFLNKDCCCCSLTAYLSNRCGGISIIYRILRLAYASGWPPDSVIFVVASVLKNRRSIFAAMLRVCCLVPLTVSSIIVSFEIYPRKNRAKIVGCASCPLFGLNDFSYFVITLRRQLSSRFSCSWGTLFYVLGVLLSSILTLPA